MRTWQAHPDQVWGLAFSPDSKLLASCGRNDGHARLWNPLTGEPLGRVGTRGLRVPAEHSTCVAFSPDSRWLAIVLVDSDGYADVRICDVTGSLPVPVAEFGVEATPISGLAFNAADPPVLFAADRSRVIVFQNAFDPSADAPPVFLSRGPDRNSPHSSRVLVSPDGRWVASHGRIRSVVWDAATLTPRYTRTRRQLARHRPPAAFAPSSDWLASGHGTKVDLWAFAAADVPVVELVGHKLPVWGVGYSPDGRRVHTASSDGTVRTWEAATGRPLRTYDWGVGKLYAAAFAPDGLVGAAGTEDGRIVVWDAEG